MRGFDTGKMTMQCHIVMMNDLVEIWLKKSNMCKDKFCVSSGFFDSRFPAKKGPLCWERFVWVYFIGLHVSVSITALGPQQCNLVLLCLLLFNPENLNVSLSMWKWWDICVFGHLSGFFCSQSMVPKMSFVSNWEVVKSVDFYLFIFYWMDLIWPLVQSQKLTWKACLDKLLEGTATDCEINFPPNHSLHM